MQQGELRNSLAPERVNGAGIMLFVTMLRPMKPMLKAANW